jgi:hypothetical protein
MAVDYEARVDKGIALLTSKRPGWYRGYNLDTLDVANGDACVTAQYSGLGGGSFNWHTGMTSLGLTQEDANVGSYTDHGFNAESEDAREEVDYLPENYQQRDAYDLLNQLWKDKIAALIAADSKSGDAS